MSKKLLIGFVLLVLMLTPLFGQTAYRANDKVLQAGFGLGMAGIYGDSGVPPVSAAISFGYNENISFGGVIGYASSKYTWGTYLGEEYGWKYTYVAVLARGSYHFDVLNSEKIDTYVGVSLGYNVVSASEFGDYVYSNLSASESYLLYGAHLGLRYYFNPKFGIFGELGYGLAYATFGVCLKL